MENFIAVLDLGTYEIRGAIGRMNANGKLSLLASDTRKSEGIQRGNILNPDFVARTIRELSLSLEKKTGKQIAKYYVNTGGMLIYQKQNKAYRLLGDKNEVDEELVKDITAENFKVTFENGAEVIDVVPLSYTVDEEFEVHHQSPIGSTGSKLEGEFLVTAIRQTGLEVLARTLQKAGVEKHEILLAPKILGEAVLTEEEKEIGAVAIDVGAGKTSIIIYHGGVVRHAAVLPFGGDVVTKDLVSGCGIVKDKAEKMKRKFGSAMAELQSDNDFVSISGSEGWDPKEVSCKTLAYIIQARMEEIFSNVMYQIDKSGLYDLLGAGIVLTGGTSKMKDIVPLLKYKTGLDVRLGTGARGIEDAGGVLKDSSLSMLAGMLKLGKPDCMKEKVEPIPKQSVKKTGRRKTVSSPGLWDKLGDRFNSFFDEDDNAL